jgi:hypothetical protein
MTTTGAARGRASRANTTVLPAPVGRHTSMRRTPGAPRGEHRLDGVALVRPQARRVTSRASTRRAPSRSPSSSASSASSASSPPGASATAPPPPGTPPSGPSPRCSSEPCRPCSPSPWSPRAAPPATPSRGCWAAPLPGPSPRPSCAPASPRCRRPSTSPPHEAPPPRPRPRPRPQLALAQAPPRPYDHVVVVSFDGMRPDGMERADAPTLHRMRAEGAAALGAVRPSATPPRSPRTARCSPASRCAPTG